MSLADRLRGIVRQPGGPEDVRRGGPSGPPEPTARRGGPSGPPDSDAVAEALGGEWREARGHRYLVVDRTYRPGHRLGATSIADCLPSPNTWWLQVLAGPTGPALQATNGGPTPPGTGSAAPAAERLLFLDLETTGLGGGAGTSAFLVGCGWFDQAVFRTRQFFLASYAGERALLEAVGEMADGAAVLVTYNGKAFDLPLIETRFLFHRLEAPFAAVPHIDMLHPARRLWRPDAPAEAGGPAGCRLASLEQTLLGHVREDDVPGFEIPGRYFHYVRTGDPRPLEPVFEHNRLDLVSLAMLTARAGRLLEEGPAAARTAREALGLGRLYERVGMMAAARAAYLRAAQVDGGDVLARAEALRACALVCRRDRQHDEAAGAWRRVLELRRCPPHIAREAAEALAVYHEHRVRDLHAARGFALQSLQFNISLSRAEAVQHRLARLNRKLGGPPAHPAPLF